MSTSTTAAPITYHLRPTDPSGHIFTVTCRVEAPDPEGQLFSLPAWIPGSYLLRDYARHVVSVEAVADGLPVPLRKLDKATWRIAPVTATLLLRAEIYANDLSVRGAFLDWDHAFINGVCVFFRIHGQEQARCTVHIDPPDGGSEQDWQVATALTRLTGRSGDFGAFEAVSYEALIDAPLLLGPLLRQEFDVAGITHEIAIFGAGSVDLDRLGADLQRICEHQWRIFGELPVTRYTFLVTAVAEAYGGLEHRDSSALLCARRDLPRPGMTEVSADYRKFLGLVSHEYFHLWNVKRIRPAEFTPYALERENYTRQLWLFEGMTAYYDDLSLLRSGAIGLPAYLELLGRSLTSVYRSQGRRRQTLEEASFDAWIKFYRPDENAPNALVSYYTKGAMVALALDLELRLRTEGRVCLDDLMRALWEQFGKDGSHGVPDGAFERLADDVSGLRLEEFFRQSLRSMVDPPVGILLAQFGVRLHLRPAEPGKDPGGTAGKRESRPQPWLGLRTRADGQRVIVSHVMAGSPAMAAGLAAEDELVAINQQRVSVATLDGLLDDLPLDHPANIHVFRRGELRVLPAQPGRPPRDTAYLSLEADADPASLERRRHWLGA